MLDLLAQSEENLTAGDAAGWEKAYEAWQLMQTWSALPEGVPPAAEAAFLKGADLYALACAEERVAPHHLPAFLEPALAIVRAQPAWRVREAEYVHALARCHLDFGRLDQARALLADTELERLRQSGSPYAAWCALLGAVVLRLDSRVADAEDRLNDLAAAVDVKQPLQAELPAFISSERVALALHMGRIDLAALELQRLTESAAKFPHSWVVEHVIRLHRMRIYLSSARALECAAIADKGKASLTEHAIEQGVTGRALRATNTLRARYELLAGKAALQLGHYDQARVELEAAVAGKDVGAGRVEDSLGALERTEAELCLAQLAAWSGRAADALVHLEHVRQGESRLARPAESSDGGAREPWTLGPRYVATQALVARVSGAERSELLHHQQQMEIALVEFLRLWENTPLDATGVGFLQHEERRFVLDEWIELCRALDGEVGAERALQGVIAMQARGRLARQGAIPSPTLAEVREVLCPAGTGLMVFLPASRRMHLFLIDAEAIQHLALPALEDLRVQIAPFVHLLSIKSKRQSPERLARAAASLIEELLPEQARSALAAWDRIGIVGADLLGGLPLEILPLADGTPLGIAKAVWHLPSLPFAVHRKRSLVRDAQTTVVAEQALDILAFIAPTLSVSGEGQKAQWSPLRSGKAHAAALERIWRNQGQVRLLYGDQATLRALQKSATRPIRCLHLFTHGYTLPDDSRPASAVLGGPFQQNLLSPRLVEELWSETGPVAPRIVTLAVCSTARGPIRLGEDAPAHLGGAFLAAGSELVLLSAYDLEESATATLYAHFHQALAEGSTPAEALRKARAALAGEEGFAHPSDWGLVVALGLADEPL